MNPQIRKEVIENLVFKTIQNVIFSSDRLEVFIEELTNKINTQNKNFDNLKKKNDKKHELVTADSKELTEKDLWRPLQPIGTIYFLTHPKKAVYFFLLQKSLMFSWRLARKYFKD